MYGLEFMGREGPVQGTWEEYGQNMRGRRFWYLIAVLLLLGAIVVAVIDPFQHPACIDNPHVPRGHACDMQGAGSPWASIIIAVGLLGGLLLTLIGTIRDPPS
jgi:hypothetical protein